MQSLKTLLLLIMLSGIGIIAVQAQETVQITINSTPNWNFASLPCSSCGQWRLNNENTFFYLNYSYTQLVVLKADGTPATLYDVSIVKQTIDSDGIWYNFIPFEDGSLVFSTRVRSGWGNFLYNYETGQISPAYSKAPNTVKTELCSAANNPDSNAIARMGIGKKLIGCSMASGNILQINVFDLDNNTELTIPMGVRDAGETVGWGQIIGGDNGYAYISSNAPIQTSYPLNTEYFNTIKRYNPSTQSWTEIPIPKTWLARVPTDAGIINASVLKIDMYGNIYYSLIWNETITGIDHVDLLKIAENGQLVWHVTEAELGQSKYPSSIFLDGSILLTYGADYSQFELITISLATPPATPTNLLTFTPTNTPIPPTDMFTNTPTLTPSRTPTNTATQTPYILAIKDNQLISIDPIVLTQQLYRAS